MEHKNQTEECSEVHRIWIGEQEKIASFHEVHTYELRIIEGHAAYVNCLQGLQEQGFRFQ